MTTIVLDNREWNKIRPKIDSDYGKITTMISWRLRETLGFTVRHHQDHNPINGHWVQIYDWTLLTKMLLLFLD